MVCRKARVVVPVVARAVGCALEVLAHEPRRRLVVGAVACLALFLADDVERVHRGKVTLAVLRRQIAQLAPHVLAPDGERVGRDLVAGGAVLGGHVDAVRAERVERDVDHVAHPDAGRNVVDVPVIRHRGVVVVVREAAAVAAVALAAVGAAVVAVVSRAVARRTAVAEDVVVPVAPVVARDVVVLGRRDVVVLGRGAPGADGPHAAPFLLINLGAARALAGWRGSEVGRTAPPRRPTRLSAARANHCSARVSSSVAPSSEPPPPEPSPRSSAASLAAELADESSLSSFSTIESVVSWFISVSSPPNTE